MNPWVCPRCGLIYLPAPPKPECTNLGCGKVILLVPA